MFKIRKEKMLTPTRHKFGFRILVLFMSSLVLAGLFELVTSTSYARAANVVAGWAAPASIDPAAGKPTSISCPSSTNCFGVDDVGNVLELSAGSWAEIPSVDPNTYVSSISCPTTIFCIAVDGGGSFMTFNGITWSQPVSFDPGTSPSALSCASPTYCVAVDVTGGAAVFNGTTWSSVATIDSASQSSSNGLTAISCPQAGDCVAVDGAGNVVIQNSGTFAAPELVDSGNNFTGISCPQVGDCVAVDGAGNAVIESSGTWASPVLVDKSASLTSISCTSSTSCVAADSMGGLVSLNGTSWSSVSSLDPGYSFRSISCSGVVCVALDNRGYALQDNLGVSTSLSEVESGSDHLTSISCDSSSFCVAVDVDGKAMVWNGSNWSPPTKVSMTARLTSISCPGASSCIAVDGQGGSYLYSSGVWTAGSSDSMTNVNAVACSSTVQCFAVSGGGYISEFSGPSWSTPQLADSNGDLTSISCASSTFCGAVDGNGYGLIWNGASWSSPTKVDSQAGLTSITCFATNSCVAVDSSGNYLTFISNSWSTTSSINNGGLALESISCTSITFCMAVDESGSAFNLTTSGWSTQSNVDPNPNYPTSISCPTTAFCMAVDFSGHALSWTPINSGVFYPTGPVRVCDTRSSSPSNQCSGETMSGGSVLNVGVVGVNSDGVPSNASAVVANVTAVAPTLPGFLSIWPTGTLRPTVSSLNFSAGEYAVANLVEIPIGANGDISVYNSSGNTDVLVDVEGWVGPSVNNAGYYNPLTSPVRLADTRPNSTYQDAGATLGPNGSINVNVDGQGGVPSNGVSAVVVNVTATNTSANGFVSAYPAGGSSGGASTVNFTMGSSVPNRAIVPVGSNGEITIKNGPGDTTDVVVDISGYFTSSTSTTTGLVYQPIQPERIVDTRAKSGYQGAGSTLSDGVAEQFTVAGYGGIPSSGASAVMSNVTVTNTVTTTGGFLTIYPTGQTMPATSDLNWSPNETVPNAVLATLGTNGDIEAESVHSSADVIVDVFGWYGASI